MTKIPHKKLKEKHGVSDIGLIFRPQMGRIETGDLFETEESCGNGVSCGVVGGMYRKTL